MNNQLMNKVEDAFEVGKDLVSERYGNFKEEPESFTVESGLLAENKAAHTRAFVGTEKVGSKIVMYDGSGTPKEITVDEDLIKEHPDKATKSLIHELFEWRAIEELPTDTMWGGVSHEIAQFNENALCRDVNEEMGEEVCMVEWNQGYDT